MALAAFLPLLGPVIDKLVDRIPDPNERARAKEQAEADLLHAALAESSDQREINKVEAAHASIFVAGWRPEAGWVCVGGLGYHFLLAPIATGIARIWLPDFTLPPVGVEDLMVLLGGLLGIGWMRSRDKAAGVDTRTVRP